MAEPPQLAPLSGFDWTKVNWGGPDEPRTTVCSYCGDELDEASIPLILWNAEGWCAEFCDHCQATYWGFRWVDEPVEPQHEPEVLRHRARSAAAACAAASTSAPARAAAPGSSRISAAPASRRIPPCCHAITRTPRNIG